MARKPKNLEVLRDVSSQAARVPVDMSKHLRKPIADLERSISESLKKLYSGRALDEGTTREIARKARRAFGGANQATNEVASNLKKALRAGGERMRGLSEKHHRDIIRKTAPVGSLQYGGAPTAKIPLIHKMRFTGYGNKFADDVKKDLTRQIRQAHKRKESLDATLKRLAGPKHKAKLQRAASLEKRLSVVAEAMAARYQRRAELILRQELFASYNAVNARLIRSTGARRMWSAILDYRICPVCRSLDGKIVGTDEKFVYGDPPIHVNCRCIIVPVATQTGGV